MIRGEGFGANPGRSGIRTPSRGEAIVRGDLAGQSGDIRGLDRWFCAKAGCVSTIASRDGIRKQLERFIMAVSSFFPYCNISTNP